MIADLIVDHYPRYYGSREVLRRLVSTRLLTVLFELAIIFLFFWKIINFLSLNSVSAIRFPFVGFT